MQNTISDFSVSLFVWQAFLILGFVGIVFILFKLYKRYLSN